MCANVPIMKKSWILAVPLACATACSAARVSGDDLAGTWGWDDYPCSRANLEIGPDRIVMTAPDGERAPIYRVLPGEHATEDPREYILYVQLLPHPDLEPELQRSLEEGRVRYSVLLRLDGDRITPLMTADDNGARTLQQGEHRHNAFSLRRCS